MSFLEEQYLRRVSFKLRNYKEKGNHLYAFSCPICNDSSKKKNKARGYAFDKNGRLNVFCHNCGYSAAFSSFLKQVDHLLHQEFTVEQFREKLGREMIRETDTFVGISDVVETKQYVPNIFAPLPSLIELSKEHPVRKYADSRKLPYDKFEIFYVENFIEWTKGHTDKFEKVFGDSHSRIVLPFYARDGHIIGYTARSLNGEEPKYYRIFIDKDEKEKFYGINRLDESKHVYVLEGEIDSLFVPNSIAVSNGKLHSYMNKDAIYIPDADKRNKHIVKNISDMIDIGLKVCLLPGDHGKDINEMVVNGLDSEKILDIINSNVYQGLTGKLKFNQWKIVN